MHGDKPDLPHMFDMHQHRLHVLAGVQPIDTKISATAYETAQGQVANLHLVMHPAS